ncbi:MAG: VCBS repeat-containing protein, partial [Desulfobacterales bacterium]|nr:VCBS repeat-containing protein [Desulfobacterales bacterium]
YGASGSTYRLENEDFSRIHLLGSGSSMYFKVWTADGRILEYGISDDSRFSVSSGTVSWYLKNAKDYDGNTITYNYLNDTDGFRINKIQYAGNTVQFKYGERNDKNMVYMHGEAQNHNVILEEIEVLGQGSRLWSYKFKYTHDLYSRLNEIVKVASDGLQYNSTVVDWSGAPSHNTNPINIPDGAFIKCDYGDLNGDGINDRIAYHEQLTGLLIVQLGAIDGSYTNHTTFDLSFGNTSEVSSVGIGDGDGDMIDDVFITQVTSGPGPETGSIMENQSESTLHEAKSVGETHMVHVYKLNGTELQRNFTIGDFLVPDNKRPKFHLLDFNGDGQTDVAVVYEYHLQVFGYNFSMVSIPIAGGISPVHSMDVNGDGKQEVVTNYGHVFSHIEGGSGYKQLTQISGKITGDINGDGKDDYIANNKIYY